MNRLSFECNRLSSGYPALLRRVVSLGEEVPSRAGNTREVVGFTLSLGDPVHCVVGREGSSREFMDLEIAMLLAGTFDRELVERVTPRAAELITTKTAYGPRVWHQLREVETELKNDPTSRRGLVVVGDRHDLSGVHDPTTADQFGHEIPCTVSWQFLIRNGMIDAIVCMRSWDLVWGLTYDVPCFVAVQTALARALDVEVGCYLHLAGSAHVYERHWATPTWDNWERGELEIPWLADSVAETQSNARAALDEMRTAAWLRA